MAEYRKTALVTGGGGFAGGKLCEALHEKGYKVIAVDVHFLEGAREDEGILQEKGDIRDVDYLISVFHRYQVDVVFHLASYGMSGREMLKKRVIEEVNIEGTKNVIRACMEEGVSRLVYTSTYNVVFGGQEICNGDSTLPYLPADRHVDHYSKTKSIAEQLVRAASGKGDTTLKTCALRCAGIYGKGEQRHFPRIVSYIETGYFCVTYGAADSLVEFLHVDNFCQAHIKAAECMIDCDSPVVGNAYFISDGKPINNFVFFKPLVEGLGYSYPTWRVPLWMVYYTAFLIELVHSLVCKFYNFQPLLTRAEVHKTGVTHFFSMDEARQDFGYAPSEHNLDDIVEWFKARGHSRVQRSLKSSSCNWVTLIVLISISLLFLFLQTLFM